jgi:hypothetical protein
MVPAPLATTPMVPTPVAPFAGRDHACDGHARRSRADGRLRSWVRQPFLYLLSLRRLWPHPVVAADRLVRELAVHVAHDERW